MPARWPESFARGFDVELGENLSKQGMERTLDRFEAKITPGATALLFYSACLLAELGRDGNVERRFALQNMREKLPCSARPRR